jgi:subtilisin family serine protease
MGQHATELQIFTFSPRFADKLPSRQIICEEDGNFRSGRTGAEESDMMRHCMALMAGISTLALVAGPALAQSPKVPESLITAAQARPQRVIVLMAAPNQGGRQEAFRQPENFIRGALGNTARSVSGIADQPMVVAEVGSEGLRRLARSESVLRVVPDMLLDASLADSVKLLDVPEVWSKQTRGAGVAVAVLDTGVQLDHPFVKGRIVAEACFSSSSELIGAKSLCANGGGEQIGSGAAAACDYRTVTDGCVHGTHVAGIAAGAAGDANGVPLDGMAPDAAIVAVKVFSRFDGEDACGKGVKTCIHALTADVIKGLRYVERIAAERKIAAVNLSLGGGHFAGPCDDRSAYADLIGRLRAAGIAVVAASGNEHLVGEISQPACISGVIAVGAIKKSGEIDIAYSNTSAQVTIVAPGTEIISSAAGSYHRLSGTSMAAPHVAGIFALLRARNAGTAIDQLVDAMKRTGKSVTDPRNNLASTVPDAEAAMLALADGAASGPRPDGTDPRVTSCGPVCIEEGKNMRRIIFVLARGQKVTAETMSRLQESFGAKAKVEDIGDGKLVVELPVAATPEDVDKARRGVGDGTRVFPDLPLDALKPGETINIR